MHPSCPVVQQGLWSSGSGMENAFLEYKIGQNENFPQVSTAHMHCNSTEGPRGGPRYVAPCLLLAYLLNVLRWRVVGMTNTGLVMKQKMLSAAAR